MRMDRGDDRDPIWSKGSLSWRAGARVPVGRPRLRGLRGLHTLESIPVQAAIGLHHIPAERHKENQKNGTEKGCP